MKKQLGPIEVHKFGGTSVGSIERIQHVARHLVQQANEGKRVVAVVSAMSGETNRLVALAQQIDPVPYSKEYDMLLASGEQISVALLGLAIRKLGTPARALLGYQLGIKTDSVYSKARILEVDPLPLHQAWERGEIPVVAGFQGVDSHDEITTLGRGGSDTSAVAVAAALRAEECIIFTDVDGVYTTDPRLAPKARKLATITHEEMLELASLGSKVLHLRSVEIAANHGVPLTVRSSFDFTAPGTKIVSHSPVPPSPSQLTQTEHRSETRSMIEKVSITGIAADSNDVMIQVSGLVSPQKNPHEIYQIFAPLAENEIVVDVIALSHLPESDLSLAFTVPRSDCPSAVALLTRLLEASHPRFKITTQDGLTKVSIVGSAMRNHPGVAAKMFGALADLSIPIQMVSTSEIRVTALIPSERTQEAVQKLHQIFDLDL